MSFEQLNAAMLLYAKAHNIEATVFNGASNMNEKDYDGVAYFKLSEAPTHDRAIRAVIATYANMELRTDGTMYRLYFFNLRR